MPVPLSEWRTRHSKEISIRCDFNQTIWSQAFSEFDSHTPPVTVALCKAVLFDRPTAEFQEEPGNTVTDRWFLPGLETKFEDLDSWYT